MKHMAIVECISSGRLYIDDIISHGYRPLIVNIKESSDYMVEYREIIKKGIGDKADYIDECEDFDEFVKKLKEYEVVAAFAGSEYGVVLCDRIVKALGLRGNDYDTIRLRTSKTGMFEALGKAGIRRIESMLVKDEQDIRDFWKDNSLNSCVLKFAESAATVGLRICSTVDEAIEHYRFMKTIPTGLGKMDGDILIQEFIGGTEYIVDSLSCDGKHIITDIWVYQKIRADDGTLAYDYIKLVKDLEPGHTAMVQYMYKVLDAVDMKWGICHSEVKIDEKGPVLIEVNARPLGLAMTSAYLDEALGYHLTDMAVDVYLEPKRFDRLVHRIYNPPKYALMKVMIVPKDIVGSFAPTFVFSNMLRSAREVLFFGKDGVEKYSRTIDLDTSPMTIKMINSDYGELMKDYETLRTVESRYFDLLCTAGGDLKGSELKTDVNAIARNLDLNRRFLIVKDDGMWVSQYGEIAENPGNEIYDGVVFAVCGKMPATDRYRAIFRAMHNIRSGGVFITVPESYEDMESGSVVVDFIMNIAGMSPMVPTCDSEGMLFGVKK